MWISSGMPRSTYMDRLSIEFQSANVSRKIAKMHLDLNSGKPYNVTDRRWKAIQLQVKKNGVSNGRL